MLRLLSGCDQGQITYSAILTLPTGICSKNTLTQRHTAAGYRTGECFPTSYGRDDPSAHLVPLSALTTNPTSVHGNVYGRLAIH